MRTFFIALFVCLVLAQTAFAKDWYVDGLNGNDNNAGTSATSAYKNGWKGTQAAQPGDTVHFLPTTTYPNQAITKSGTASAYITLMGEGTGTNLTKVNGGGDFGIQVNGGASYVIVKNFDIQAPGGWYGVYVGNASHNVQITGNTIHNAGGGGIGTTHADYLTISHNTITNTAFFTTNGDFGSGISIYESNNTDTNTGVKIIIDSNIVYNNTNTPDCVSGVCAFGGMDSDGNGIIIDDSRHTQSDNVVYKGMTLIENNIVYNNGGRGIYGFFSDHMTIVNNTVYYNNQDPYESAFRPGEIMVQSGGGDVKIYNNIAFSDGLNVNAASGPHVTLSVESATDGVGPVYADYNQLYNATNTPGLMYYAGTDSGHNNTNVVTFDLHNLWGNPLFNVASNNAATADFHLQTTSPAFGTGLPTMASLVDILGNPRSTSTGPVDKGAYQQVPLPSCGPAKSILGLLTGALCNVGTSSSVLGLGPWSWTCANGGQTVNCSSVLVTNGSCGPSNGSTLTSKPTTNLCNAGTASAVAGSGPWTWSCAGINGGTTASCGASLQAPPLAITVVASEDNYLGDATFGLLINGVQMTTATVTASHTAGAWQTLTFSVPAPTTLTSIGVAFNNDLYGGSKTADRNLYIQSIKVNGSQALPTAATYVTYKGVSSVGAQLMFNNGTMTWPASAFKPTTLNFSVVVSGDAYSGNAIAGLTVNGSTVATATVTAVHTSGQWQTLTFSTPMPAVLSNFGVSFSNDMWGGSTAADRNLYVQSIAVNGTTLQPNQGSFKPYNAAAQTGQSLMWTNGLLTWNSTLLP